MVLETTGKIRKEENPIEYPRLIDDQTYGYFHDLIHNLLNYRPKETSLLVENNDIANDLSLAQRQLDLLQNRPTTESNAEEAMKNIFEENTLFQRIGIGLNDDEIYW